MENNNGPVPSPTLVPEPPQQPNDNVWLSREEYERMKHDAESYRQIDISTASFVTATPQEVSPQFLSVKMTGTSIVLLISAVALFLAFTTEVFAFLAVPAVLALVIFGIKGIVDALRPTFVDGPQGQVKSQSKTKKIITGIIIAIALLLGAQLILPAFAIIFLIIMIGFGGGDVGS